MVFRLLHLLFFFSPRKFFSFGIPKPLTCGYTYSCDCCCSHIFCVCVYNDKKKRVADVRVCNEAQEETVQLEPARLSPSLSQPTVALSKKITVTSVSFSSALKEFCQPTPGVGPRFSFQFFLSYFFVVALNMYLLYFFC